MPWVVFYAAIFIWLIGIVLSLVIGGFLHLLLVVAAAALIWDLVKNGRKRPVQRTSPSMGSMGSDTIESH